MVGNPLLSERDGNISVFNLQYLKNITVGNPLLSERDGNPQVYLLDLEGYHLLVGNPLLSERDGNSSVPYTATLTNCGVSETHYSLKEMETITININNTVNIEMSETHYSLKEMETIVPRPLQQEHNKYRRKPTTL